MPRKAVYQVKCERKSRFLQMLFGESPRNIKCLILHELNLTNRFLKTADREVDKKRSWCKDMYFGFMPGCTTTDAVFIFRQLSSSVIGKALNKKGFVLPFCTFRENFWPSSKVCYLAGLRKLSVEGRLVNPLSTDPTKWSNTPKQFVGRLPANCLSVFDHFVALALKGLRMDSQCIGMLKVVLRGGRGWHHNAHYVFLCSLYYVGNTRRCSISIRRWRVSQNTMINLSK